MPLSLTLSESLPTARTLLLEGRLDSQTAAELDAAVDRALAPGVERLVLDLAGLTYISSMGLRSLFLAQKAMAARRGELLLLHPQPAVQKVFDIVGAVDVLSVFADTEELDAYLTSMQQKVEQGEI